MINTAESNGRLLQLFRACPQEDLKDLFERHEVNTIEELVDEIRRDGANSLVTWIFRLGDGVDYGEIVQDVARKVGAKYDPGEDRRNPSRSNNNRI